MSEENLAVQDDNDELMAIVKLRTAIGLLGEKDQANWWPSLWFASNAVAFLSPIYGERTNAARYQGLVETARQVHDERIGFGRAFHLFRLPETLERRIHDAVFKDDLFRSVEVFQNREEAEAFLSDIEEPVEGSPGPTRVGSDAELEGFAWTGVIAGHYLAALKNSQQTFPYFAEGL